MARSRQAVFTFYGHNSIRIVANYFHISSRKWPLFRSASSLLGASPQYHQSACETLPLSPSDGERDGARGHPTPVHGVGRSPSPHPMGWAGVRGRLLAFSRYGCFVCIRVKQNAIRFFMTEEHVPSMGSAQIQPAIVRAVPQWNSHARGAKLFCKSPVVLAQEVVPLTGEP